MYTIEAIVKFIKDPSSRKIIDESTAALMEAEEAERKAAEIEKRKGGKG